MDTITLKPVRELRTVWLIVWFIWFVLALIAGVTPLIAQYLGASIRGAFPSMIIIAVLCAIMVPILLWLPAYYAALEYWIEPGSVGGKRGVFWRRITTVPYHKITNIDITQGPLQRAFGIGTLHIQTAGAAGSQGGQAELLVHGVKDLEGLKETILQYALQSIDGKRQVVPGAPKEDAGTLGRVLEELIRIRKAAEKDRN
jgi:membrane protein YdbS with pleckstrin-like domain